MFKSEAPQWNQNCHGDFGPQGQRCTWLSLFWFHWTYLSKKNENKNSHLSSASNDWNINRNGLFSIRTTLTNKVNGDRDEANFDGIELVYRDHRRTDSTGVSLSRNFISLLGQGPWGEVIVWCIANSELTLTLVYACCVDGYYGSTALCWIELNCFIHDARHIRWAATIRNMQLLFYKHYKSHFENNHRKILMKIKELILVTPSILDSYNYIR